MSHVEFGKAFMEKIQSRINDRIRLTESHLKCRNLDLQHLIDIRGVLKYPASVVEVGEWD